MSKRIFAPPRLLSITTAAALILMSGAVASAQELPTYEVSGFPITPVQLSLLNTAHVHERVPTTNLTVDGMPASPNQIDVLGVVAGVTEVKGDVIAEYKSTSGLTPYTLQVEMLLHKAASFPALE